MKIINQEDSGFIFNRFLEILRHNVVSDKPNAFNKLITLLLCKIVDEDRGENEELFFQWLEIDTSIDLQKRLNDLYKIGMDKYLTKIVTDYSDKDVENIVGLNEAQKETIKKMITELRLKKNNEFAFKEVFNDQSFDENSKVLKEVVELLQPYQVRYNKKQQFLGDFFELLLNTSIKQEAGQFFTPVPIARFIINSIPIKSIISTKIANGDPDFLPFVIDYAVGSGHFLTEAMDEIHRVVSDLNENGDFRPSIKKGLSKWSEDYDWAYKFIYGVEKDYRLVKTAKVSCFLNGDGLARIFNADGLANFQNDTDYKDKLKIVSKADPKDNQEFDILIANPPYSVSAFKNTLVDGDKSFELYKRLTEESSEIECLFIERTKQLLKDGAYAGIVLPSSILNNSGIYTDAREILLKYFKIIAITEFGSNTFMATGTNTVTLFLQRRNSADWRKVEHCIAGFFSNHTDMACNEVENPFSKYVAHIYKTISFKDYVSLMGEKPNEAMKKHELFIDYQKAFDDLASTKNLKKRPAFKLKSDVDQAVELDKFFYSYVFGLEREKLLYFILAYPQKTLLIKSNPDGKNETEKEFLGYEFSNRRGHEGIKPYGAITVQEATKLYDENNTLNPERVSSHIYSAFLGDDMAVSEDLQKHITKQNFVDMVNFDRIDFIKSISLALKKKIKITSKWDLEKLGKVCNIKIGGTPSRDNSEFYKNGNNLWVSISEMDGKIINDTKEKITDTAVSKSNVKLVKAGTTLVSFKLSIGKTAIAGKDLYTNEAVVALEVKDEYVDKLTDKYLFSIFNSKFIALGKTDHNAFGKSLNSEDLKTVLIPLPPRDIQEKITKEMEVIEKEEKSDNAEIQEIKQVLFDLVNAPDEEVSVRSIAVLRGEKIEPQNFPNEKFNYIGLEHIQSGTGELLDWAPTKGAALKSSKNIFKKGDVLYGKLRPYLNKVYLAEFEGICSTDILVLQSDQPKILKYLLLSDAFVAQSSALMKGVSLPRLQPKEFLNFLVPFSSNESDVKKLLAKIESAEIRIKEVWKELDKVSEKKASLLKKYL